MLSMSIHSGIKTTLPCLSFPSQNPILPFKPSSSLKQNPSSSPSLPHKLLSISCRKSEPIKRIYALATAEAEAETSVDELTAGDESTDGDESSGYDGVASTGGDQEFEVEKAKLVLKFIWMEKNIGIGLDQEIKGHGRVPLSPYFFWPRKDAWEELKTTLESKPWVTQKMMIILLNQATDIINLWQQSGGNLT